MSVLQDATAIVKEAERLVIGTTLNPSGRLAAAMVDALLHGPFFVFAGMEALARLLLRGSLLALLWAMLLYVLTFVQPDRNLTATALFSAASLLGVGSILFGLPSSLIARLLNADHVARLAAEISGRAEDKAHMDLLRKGVDEIDTAGTNRIAAISWAIGLTWASLAWFAANWVFTDDATPASRGEAVAYGVLALVIFSIIAGAFVSYREAHRQLRLTIVFAFADAERQKTHIAQQP